MKQCLGAVTRLLRSARQNNQKPTVAAMRAAESLVRLAIPPLSNPLIGLGHYDAVVYADLTTPTGLRLLRYGFHDAVAWAVNHLLRPGDSFIDAGANIGLMTLVGAARVGPAGHVISCEPSPATARLLKRNIEANSFAWVNVEQAAIGDVIGRAELVEFEAGAGLHSFSPRERAGGHSVVVDVVRLDDLVGDRLPRPALVKLDIEGAEVSALRGARDLLKERRSVFIVEVEPDHLRRQGSSVAELREQFVGYAPQVIRVRQSGFELYPWHGHWSALPEPRNLVLIPVAGAH